MKAHLYKVSLPGDLFCTLAIRLMCYSVLLFSGTHLYAEEAVQQSDTLADSTPVPAYVSGSIILDIFPDTAHIFINGQRLPDTTRKISSLRQGKYEILITHHNRLLRDTIEVKANAVIARKYRIARRVRFTVSPVYSQVYVKGLINKGPGLCLGLQWRKVSWGIDYNGDFVNNQRAFSDALTLGGSIFWYYDIIQWRDILIVSPGFCAGFWGTSASLENNNPYYDGTHYFGHEYDYFETYQAAGLSARILVGQGPFYLRASYTLLLGTIPAHLMQLGLEFHI